MQDDWSDDALYAGLIKREPRALEALITRYSREISYFIRMVLDGVGTAQDAEECANDLFIIAWQEVDAFDPSRGSLHTWLTMRAKYIALDRRRQMKRRQEQVTSLDSRDGASSGAGDSYMMERRSLHLAQLTDQNMERLLEQQERREELLRAIDTLPTLDRFLVYMRYIKLASTEEISAKTKLTRHAIDTRLWRARKALREALEERMPETGAPGAPGGARAARPITPRAVASVAPPPERERAH